MPDDPTPTPAPEPQHYDWMPLVRQILLYVLIALGGGAAGTAGTQLCQPAQCPCVAGKCPCQQAAEQPK